MYPVKGAAVRPEAVRRLLRQRKAGLGVLYRIGKKTPVHSNVPCVSRLPPVSFNRYSLCPGSPRYLFTGTVHVPGTGFEELFVPGT